jgi:hypothetical protein
VFAHSGGWGGESFTPVWCENSLLAIGHFHSVGVARAGPWNTSIKRRGTEARAHQPDSHSFREDLVVVELWWAAKPQFQFMGVLPAKHPF